MLETIADGIQRVPMSAIFMTQADTLLKRQTMPKEIRTWLEENKHCSHADLIHSLLDGRHDVCNAVSWVASFFGEKFAPGHAVREPARTLVKFLGMDEHYQGTLEVAELMARKAELNANKAFKSYPDYFCPGTEPEFFGPQFPNRIVTPDGSYRVASFSSSPRVIQVLDVLSDEDCAHLIEQTKDALKRSEVVSDESENFHLVTDIRTSQGGSLRRGQDDNIRKIEERLCSIFRFPYSHGEEIQTLNYQVGGEYQPHLDFFADQTSGRKEIGTKGNRVATIIMYLNEPEKGGETIFPHANLKILPIKGSVVYFDYLLPDGKLDPLSLHGGCPVQEGEKWIATQWIRELPQV